MKNWCAALFAALFLFVSPVFAQSVTVTAVDGDLAVTGDVLGFDGRFIRLETQYGEVTLDYSGVTCLGETCPDAGSYVQNVAFSGTPRIGTILLPALVEAFARQQGFDFERSEESGQNFSYTFRERDSDREFAQFVFRLNNTDEGFADLLANEADVAMTERKIRPSERNRALEIGLGDLTDATHSQIVALDGIVPIVSPGQVVTEISISNLQSVFAGEIINWSDLGGRDAAIRLYLRDRRSGLAQGFEDRILHANGTSLADGIKRFPTDVALANAVVSDPNALGITAFEGAEDIDILELAGPCGLGAVAERAAFRTEDYPLTLPLFLYSPMRRLPETGRAFMAYLQQPAAQRVIRRAGFVDFTGVPIPIQQQGERISNAILNAGEDISLGELQRMIRVLSDSSRLSTTFRFEVGSTRLDAQSRFNAVQLARDLEAGVYDGKRLLLIGFTDGRGPALENRDLASARADAIFRRVISTLGEEFRGDFLLETDAFGEALPMACDDTEWGRQVNRRVEVWVGPLK
jgi:phosphate transport system substrate-binding protein